MWSWGLVTVKLRRSSSCLSLCNILGSFLNSCIHGSHCFVFWNVAIPLCVKNFVNNSSCHPLNPLRLILHPSYTCLFPFCHLSQVTLVFALRRNVLWHVPISDLRGHLSSLAKTFAENLVTLFLPPSPLPIFSSSRLPPADQSIRRQSFKNSIISETTVVGNQLTFTSSLSPRPRTWMWLRRWSAWCWKSSTLACATLSTTTPTWCMRCSTRGSSLSSSGCTPPSRTSCRTWTRSVPFLFLVLNPNVSQEVNWEEFGTGRVLHPGTGWFVVIIQHIKVIEIFPLNVLSIRRKFQKARQPWNTCKLHH